MAPFINYGYPYHSATEYQFNENETDAIIRTVSYHRIDFDLAVIWFSPREHDAIRSSIATPFSRPPDVGFDSLNELPLELLREILIRLDMQSLFHFRQTCLRSREAVDSLKEYQMIVLHGLNLFRALLRTKLGIETPLLDFYDILCTKACSVCGKFGRFVSILIWKRCCFRCIKIAPQIRMRTLRGVQKQLRLNEAGSEQFRSFKTLPGRYTLWETQYKGGITVVSHQQARLIGQQPCYTMGNPLPMNRGTRDPKYNCMASCALPYYDKLTGNVEHGMSCAGCALAFEKRDTNDGMRSTAAEVRDKVHSREGILEHFKWCEQAQLLWRTSHGGTKTPPELPSLARDGGYLKKRE